LLKLSGLVINIAKSRDYFLLLVNINIVTIFLFYVAEVELKYVFAISCAFILQIIKEFKTQKPHPELESIIFDGKSWLIRLNDSHLHTYTKFKIRLNTGFFSFITFYAKSKPNKNVIVFHDQISNMHRRHLYILAKLMR
jgi:hypothetical protein